jgi:hypothetical protein
MTDYLIEEVPEITRDLKKIRINSFDEDYNLFKQALPHMLDEIQYHRTHKLFQISDLGKIDGRVYKAKKIPCKSLRANDKFRIIFQIIGSKIRIIEVYYKGQQENHDRDRVIKYCASK